MLLLKIEPDVEVELETGRDISITVSVNQVKTSQITEVAISLPNSFSIEMNVFRAFYKKSFTTLKTDRWWHLNNAIAVGQQFIISNGSIKCQKTVPCLLSNLT